MNVRRTTISICAVASILVVGCGGGPGGGGGTLDRVLDVALQGPAMPLVVGDVVTLEAVVTVEGSASTDVTWSSTDPTVAPVTSGGLVTAASAGSTTIRATSVDDASKFASATVQVSDVGGLSVRWTRQYGSVERESVAGVAVDGLGRASTIGSRWTPTTGGRGEEALVESFLSTHDSVGDFVGSMTWAPGAFTAVAYDVADNLLLAGESYVWKYVGGSHTWTADFGESATVTDVTTDANANVIAVGWTTGALAGPSAGSADAFVRRIGPTGGVVWTRQFGTSEWDVATAVATDASNNVYVAGVTHGSLVPAVDGDQGATFVRKFDAAGNTLWTRQFGWAAFAQDVVVDSSGNVYVVGSAYGEVASGQFVSTDEAGFVRAYDASGAPLWSRLIEDGASTAAWGAAIGSDGTVLVAGSTSGALGTGPNAGEADAFVRAYAPNGSASWTHQFGTSAADVARAVTVAPDGDVIVSGETFGSLAASNSGRADVFVRRLTP